MGEELTLSPRLRWLLESSMQKARFSGGMKLLLQLRVLGLGLLQDGDFRIGVFP
jgi:hypothetical protein